VDTSKAMGTGFNGPAPVTPVTGTGTCKGELKETYGGYQFGFDLGRLNLGGTGGNLHFGVMAGYFDSRSRDITGDLSYQKHLPGLGGIDEIDDIFSPPGGFRAETQVPFLGLYSPTFRRLLVEFLRNFFCIVCNRLRLILQSRHQLDVRFLSPKLA